MRGIVTDIQRFSVHDGFGIRTTVFLKGCNLRCLWCHNPEAIAPKPQLAFVRARCIACLDCIGACGNDAIRLDAPSGRAITDFARCRNCFDCVPVCYAGARVIIGRAVEAAELVDEVAVDQPYYGDDGGVTFSGGEPLMQRRFLGEVVDLCERRGIGCAVETALCFAWKSIEDVIAKFRFVMYDIKAMDDSRHRALTGRSNRLILANARHLADAGIQAIVRTPVIPEVNADQVPAIAQFVAELPNVLYYELLPYNPLAEDKFSRLGQDFALAGLGAPSPEQMKSLVNQARSYGLPVKRTDE